MLVRATKYSFAIYLWTGLSWTWISSAWKFAGRQNVWNLSLIITLSTRAYTHTHTHARALSGILINVLDAFRSIVSCVSWWWPATGFSYLVVTVCSHVSEERTASQSGSGGCRSNLEGGMCRLCGKVWGDFGQLRKGKRVNGLYWTTWFRVFQELCFPRSAAVVSLKMEGVRSSETPEQTSATGREPKKTITWAVPAVKTSKRVYVSDVLS